MPKQVLKSKSGFVVLSARGDGVPRGVAEGAVHATFDEAHKAAVEMFSPDGEHYEQYAVAELRAYVRPLAPIPRPTTTHKV